MEGDEAREVSELDVSKSEVGMVCEELDETND